MGQRISKKRHVRKGTDCVRCHLPLERNEWVFCLHCQFIVDDEMEAAEEALCRICGDDRPNDSDGSCMGCGSV